MAKKSKQPLPVCEKKCPTCPWIEGSPYAALRTHLTASSMTGANRICHSTGRSAIYGRTGKPAASCRGARDTMLAYFAASGFLSAPTDEAWAAKWKELQDAKNT